jgi:hypothetical protein
MLSTRTEATESGNGCLSLLTNPLLAVNPKWMVRVERAGRPSNVNEEIVEVLLNIVHDFLDVIVRVIAERTDTRGRVPNRVLVARPDRSGDVLTEEPDYAGLVGIGHGH